MWFRKEVTINRAVDPNPEKMHLINSFKPNLKLRPGSGEQTETPVENDDFEGI